MGGEGCVTVWLIDLAVAPCVVRRCAAWLDAAERRRAERRSGVPGAYRRFVVAHGALRDILAQALDWEPAALAFAYERGGKPRLRGATLHFNLSHSRDLALLAVGCAGPLGVDVEYQHRGLEPEALARQVFSRAERRELAAVPVGQREEAFFNGWTRKEALIKAWGGSLFRDARRFSVSLTPGRPARIAPPLDALWRIHDFEPRPGYKAALATPVGVRHWSLRRWTP